MKYCFCCFLVVVVVTLFLSHGQITPKHPEDVLTYLPIPKGFSVFQSQQAHNATMPRPVSVAQVVTSSDTTLLSAVTPSVTPTQLDHWLCHHQSPACGTGSDLYRDGLEYGIDPVYAVAFAGHETSYGNSQIAQDTRGMFNIRCVGWSLCADGFRAYTSWSEGERDWFQLIYYYIHTVGRKTVPDVVAMYAPPSDNNDDPVYISSVQEIVQDLRASS